MENKKKEEAVENDVEKSEVEKIGLMAPEAIVERAKIVYGRHGWQTGLARDSGCTGRYVAMMLTDKIGRRPLSDGWNIKFQEAIRSRASMLASLAA